MPAVRLVNITKKFENIVADDNVSLQIHDKEYFSIIGPSGCGKTTLLRLIAGLVQPDEGEIYIDNSLVNLIPPEDRRIGYVFQEYALFPHMSVWDNVTYGPRVKDWGEEDKEKIGREMLEMVKLYDRFDALPSKLSGGMMQRVGVARALAAGAKLLLLDEPLGALDAKIRFELRYEIRNFAKDLGLTAVHVTHDQAEAMAISDRIAVMKKGKILQVGTPQELYMKPKNLFVAYFIGESNFLEGFVSKVKEKESIIELQGGLSVRTLDKAYKIGERVVIVIRPQSLEIKKGHKRSTNSFFGEVEKIRFEGTDTRHEVRLENGDLLTTVHPSLSAELIDAGEKVTISFPADKTFVFKYPDKGLRKELALE